MACLVAATLTSCQRAEPSEPVDPLPPAEVEAAVATITEEDFARKVGVIADDSLAGRATPSPGLDAAAEWIALDFARLGLEPAGDDGGFVSRYPIEGSDVTAPNVVGILRGRDAALRDEYIVFSAHMDHIGVGDPDAQGDSIFNGADDDASGTVTVMEVAEAMASLPSAPRRSMIFLLVSGEEGGLWGSDWFTEHPPAPLKDMVAAINLDMVGRNWTDTIAAIGKEQSDLGATLDAVAADHPELGMEPVGDLWPGENFYFRSDHYNFARRGVPVLFFFNGTHDDYHGLDDEPDRIDAEKASRISRLVFHLGLRVAERGERPRWDPDSYDAIVRGRR